MSPENSPKAQAQVLPDETQNSDTNPSHLRVTVVAEQAETASDSSLSKAAHTHLSIPSPVITSRPKTPSPKRISLTDVVFYDFNELLKLQNCTEALEQERKDSLRKRLSVFLSPEREKDYRDRLETYLQPKLAELQLAYRFNELSCHSVLELLALTRQARQENAHILVNPRDVVKKMVDEVIHSYRDALKRDIKEKAAKTPQQQRELAEEKACIDSLLESFSVFLRSRSDRLSETLSALDTQEKLENFKQSIEEETEVSLNNLTLLQMLMADSKDITMLAENYLSQHTLGKKFSLSPNAEQELQISQVDEQGETLLTKAFLLEDAELIDNVLAYAEDVDKEQQDKAFSHKANILHHALADTRITTQVLLYLLRSGSLTDLNFIENLRKNPSADDDKATLFAFADIFDAHHRLQDQVWAELIQQAGAAAWPKLAKALKQRFALTNDPDANGFPDVIWQALCQRQAECERERQKLTELTPYFSEVLEYLVKAYHKDVPHYQAKVQAVIGIMQKPGATMSLEAVAQAVDQALQDDQSLHEQRRHCCLPGQAKTVRLLANTQRTLLKSLAKPKPPVRESQPMPAAVDKPKSGREILFALTYVGGFVAKKAECQQRWLLIQQVFHRTLTYLNTRKLGKQESDRDSKKNLMDEVIKKFVIGEIPAEKLLAELTPNKTEANYHSRLAKKVGFFKSTTAKWLKKDIEEHASVLNCPVMPGAA